MPVTRFQQTGATNNGEQTEFFGRWAVAWRGISSSRSRHSKMMRPTARKRHPWRVLFPVLATICQIFFVLAFCSKSSFPNQRLHIHYPSLCPYDGFPVYFPLQRGVLSGTKSVTYLSFRKLVINKPQFHNMPQLCALLSGNLDSRILRLEKSKA